VVPQYPHGWVADPEQVGGGVLGNGGGAFGAFEVS
jgi:hypothetical protein